jgi:hypothetical protein
VKLCHSLTEQKRKAQAVEAKKKKGVEPRKKRGSPNKRRKVSHTPSQENQAIPKPEVVEEVDDTPSPLIRGPGAKEGLPKFHYDGHLDPKYIYFTQGWINAHFSHAPGQTPRSIFDLRDQLLEDPTYLYKVPVIRVSRRKGSYYSPDNRRLWVFRNSNLAEIPCKLVKWSPEFVNKLDNGKKEMKRTDVAIREPKKKK